VSIEQAGGPATAERRPRPGNARPTGGIAIRVAQLEKTFRVPHHQISTLKERALHPLRRTQYDELHVLRGVSFDVAEGEFFGIVGRNGSGKSTLLKCLAGIYRPDAGRIAIAGRVAPFIELGVGFNPDLTARDNVLINAVMMGLSPREAKHRIDAIVDFAELQDFVEMKLKNYSSGMQVRLAFSTMVHTEADVLLIDEVLAVGDAAFQQKCFDVFYDLRAAGKTLVFVTHDMSAVERFCHRAMLVSEGAIELLGEPEDVARRYVERNFAPAAAEPAPDPEGEDADADQGAVAEPVPQPMSEQEAGSAQAPQPDARGRLLDIRVQDADGRRVDAVPHGEPFTIVCVFRSHEDIDRARLDVWIDTEGDERVFAASTMSWREPVRRVRRGEQIAFSVKVVNTLRSGRYHLGCSLLAGSAGQDIVVLDNGAATFVTYGAERVYGLVQLDHELGLERTPPGEGP
jgi:ABC-2 type transport system ATP-binding protein